MTAVHNQGFDWSFQKSVILTIGSVALATAVTMAILALPQISSKIGWKWPVSPVIGGSAVLLLATSIYCYKQTLHQIATLEQRATDLRWRIWNEGQEDDVTELQKELQQLERQLPLRKLLPAIDSDSNSDKEEIDV